VLQAKVLQDDLRRANIEPFAWVINKSILAANTHDPLLQARLTGEANQMEKVENGMAKRICVLPWLARPPIGVEALGKLVTKSE
jgi:arsenite-transporting ATPase